MARKTQNEDKSRKLSPRWFLLVCAVVVAGAILRFVKLGHDSYMVDEINVIRMATQARGLGEVFSNELERFTFLHRMPLLMMILHSFLKVFHTSPDSLPPEWLTRLPFALMGSVTVLLACLLGTALRDRATGLWCGLLTALSVFHVFYSREAYDYSIVMFMSAGTLWCGSCLLADHMMSRKMRKTRAIAYMLFSIGLLQSHLSCLLFLTPWTGMIALTVLVTMFQRKSFSWKRIALWGLVLGAAYVVFVPFLIKLAGGFVSTESPDGNQASWAVIPQLVGRMGWGERWWAILPFSAALLLGTVLSLRRALKQGSPIHAIAVFQLLLYACIQTWALRVSRFEVRYYSAAFPLVMYLAAVGVSKVAEIASSSRLRFLRRPVPDIVLACAVGGWLLPSLLLLWQLDCRSQNYKMLASWIMENVPENGIYSYFNAADTRGVPAAYPTPGRYGTYPVPWSSAQDYRNFKVYERLVSFYERFPLAYYVELIPDDVYSPHTPSIKYIPRDRLFMRRTVLEDKAFQQLVKLGTWPLGTAQWYSAQMDKILISYNKPEDLPTLALKNNRPVYHYFGPEWGFAKDPAMNDWRVSNRLGSIYIGNVTGKDLDAEISLIAASTENLCRLSFYGPGNRKMLSGAMVNRTFNHSAQKVDVGKVRLSPGLNSCTVEVLPAPSRRAGVLLLRAISITPAESEQAGPEGE